MILESTDASKIMCFPPAFWVAALCLQSTNSNEFNGFLYALTLFFLIHIAAAGDLLVSALTNFKVFHVFISMINVFCTDE